MTKPPFDDIRVRHAIQMAVDLETINNTYYKGGMRPEPMGSIQPFTGFAIPYAEWPEEVKQYYRYDPEAAEKLLDEAGYPRGADGIRFTSSDIYRHTTSTGYREIVQGYLAEIGVQTEIRLRTGLRCRPTSGVARASMTASTTRLRALRGSL